MAATEKVTVDKAYFDALLRRADFHTQKQLLGRPDPANVNISRIEYDCLLRTARELELLRTALFQGGITADTLDLLISGGNRHDNRKDSAHLVSAWADDIKDLRQPYDRPPPQPQNFASISDLPWKQNGQAPTFNPTSGSGAFGVGGMQALQSQLRVPSLQRQVSFGATLCSVPDEGGFDDVESVADDVNLAHAAMPSFYNSSSERRTLYFSGFSERATYRDLLSVIKGGKLLSINLRPERSATVTFFEGAAHFLAWAKRNDIYIHSKRVEVKWADRQYHLNNHISNKMANGATRNILVRGAFSMRLTEDQIRAELEHIHRLVIIDIVFHCGDAYVSTNSVHNALFARTCMMSRTTYKGCKIEFYRDECDTPLPARPFMAKAPAPEPVRKKTSFANRFDMLNMDGSDDGSDEENQMPGARVSNEDDIVDLTSNSNVGVSLNFLDSESA